MIDIFTVVVPHVLMAMAIWRLLGRDPILPGIRGVLARRKAGTAHPGEDTPGA